MVPIRASVEDIQKLLSYLGKQIGWVDQSTMQKALGSIDDRKISAVVEFGLILRDGTNLRMTERGKLFNSDAQAALRETLAGVDLYKATLEWVHYGSKSEATAAEVGQYWEASHQDTLGGLKGSTLLSGAVTFGRVVEGAGLGSFLVGRGGKETRITFNLAAVDAFVNGSPPAATPDESGDDTSPADANSDASAATAVPATPAPVSTGTQMLPAPPPTPTVSVSTSPSVHVNVEIHIAADATADTVREIFKNMARYVLDKPIADDGD
jgi:hypothetical protein